MVQCNCYDCIGPIYEYDDDNRRFLWNNFKYHTLGESCSVCGHAKSEKLDLGTKGYYICWYCESRAAGTEDVSVEQEHETEIPTTFGENPVTV